MSTPPPQRPFNAIPMALRPTAANTQQQRPNRNMAGAATAPGIQVSTKTPGQIDRVTDSYTFFTQGNGITKVLYNGDRQWANVSLLLETAGPVAVGVNKEQLSPVLGGSGILLITNVQRTIPVAKGSRLYIASTTVNRVQITIEPFAWQEQIDDANLQAANAVRDLVGAMAALLSKGR